MTSKIAAHKTIQLYQQIYLNYKKIYILVMQTNGLCECYIISNYWIIITDALKDQFTQK